MKILVTGGAGYLGVSLVEVLNGKNEVEAIYVLDNLSKASCLFYRTESVGKS